MPSTDSGLEGLGRLKYSVPARNVTSCAVGGNLKLLFESWSIAALQQLLPALSLRKTPWRVIGGGSNIVIPDSGMSDMIIQLGRELSGVVPVVGPVTEAVQLTYLAEHRLRECPPITAKDGEPLRFIVFAATPLMSLSREFCNNGVAGLEFAAGIPATVGGAVKMNAGAHDSSMSDIVERVFVVRPSGEIVAIDKADVSFRYRNTDLPSGIVVAAELLLEKQETQAVMDKRAHCLSYRRKTQPLHLPSAGSVFRNPCSVDGGEELPTAGELIERVGLKGVSAHGISFSTMHANWLVREGKDGQSLGVSELMSRAQEMVKSECGIELHPEIKLW